MAAFRDFVGRMSFAAVAPPGPRLTFRALPLALLFCALTASGPARAGPEGGQVISGTVDIVRTSPERLDIVQDSDKAIIDWRSFSIDAGEHAHFEQPSSSSITLNRVTGGAHSSIFGRLTANGRIMLINPNGILFGGSASVDVGGLVATTIDIRDEDFMAGRFNFDTGGSAGGTVVNRGTITAAEGGLVALVAPGVENSGVIRARLGRVTLASGNSFTLDLHGDGLIRIGIDDRVAERLVAADGAELKALVGNSGTIGADGGVVVLLAAGAAKDVVDYAINMEGIVEARSAEERNGGIVLRGTGEGVIRVTGTLDASGRGRGETGGSVKVLGEKVGVVGEARLDASGEAGGGEILVGGNFQGRGPERNADYTAIGEGVVIRADAISGGDGGRVIVWSDRVTRFFGTITARGGSDSGDGGFAEVSGKRHLQFAPTAVDLSAPHGSIGELLLDPRDILISDSDGSDTDTTPGTDNGKISATDTVINFGDDAGTDYEIQPSAFEAINADVTLQAERDITVSSPIDRSGAADSTLTLQAGRHLTINAAITGTNGAHSFIFEADSPRSGSNDGIGKLTIGASGAITSNNGDITLIGAAFDINASSSINAGTGDIYVAPSQATAMTISATADNLSNAEIGRFTTSGTIHIGTATTGPTGSGGAGSSISATSITVSEALSVGGSASLDFDSSGTTTLGANVSTAAGDITFSDAVTLTAAVTVDSDSNSDSTDGEIEFSSTINGAFALTLDADTGSVELSGAVGGTTALASLTVTGGTVLLKSVTATGAIAVTGADGIVLNGAYDSNDGAITFTGAVKLVGAVTVDSDANGDGTDGAITFSATVGGAFALTLDADGGAVTVVGAAGGGTKLASLTVDGGQIDLNTAATTGAIDIDGTNIDLNAGSYTSNDGNITFDGAVDLHANVTVNSDANDDGTDGNIIFTSTVNGGRTLTLDADGGSVELCGAAGGTTRLTSLTVDGGQIDLSSVATTGAIDIDGTNIDLNGGSYTSNQGNIDFRAAVDLTVNVRVDSDADNSGADGNIRFHSTVDGAKTLTLDADGGAVTVGGAVGGTTALTSLAVTGGSVSLRSVTATGTIEVTGSGITLNGTYRSNDSAITFTGAVTLAGAVTVDSDADDDSNDGDITFTSTVNGGHALTLDADGGSVELPVAVGGTTKLASLTVDGGQIDLNSVAATGVIEIEGTNIDLNGATYRSDDGNITFTGPVDLHANVTVDSDRDNDGTDGSITFSSTVNGGHTLTLDADTGSVEVRGAAGGGTKLTSLTVDGGQIDLDTVATTGAIDIEGTNIDLNGATYRSDDGNITFDGAVDLHANVTVNSDRDNDGTDGNITFTSTVNGGHTLTLDADGGSVTLSGAVGGTTRLTSLTVDGGQIDLSSVATTGVIDIDGTNIDLNGAAYTSNDGDIDFRADVDLHANVRVDSDADNDGTDGDITFHSTVDGGRTLTLDADGGSVRQTGAVGGSTRLTSLAIDGGQIDLNTVATTGVIDIDGTNIDLNAGSYTSNDGNIIFRGAVDLHVNVMVNSDEDDDSADGNITFTSTIDGAHTLTLDADGGAVTVGGAVGGGTKLTSLTVDGGQIDLNSVGTTGVIDIDGSNIDLNGATYRSDDGNITFDGAVDLHASVTVDSDRDNDGTDGNITFTSTIDGAHTLTLDADTGSVSLSGAAGGTTRLTSLTVDGGQIALNSVATTGAIDIDGSNIDLNGTAYTSNDGDIDFRAAVDLHANVRVDSDADNDGTDGDITFHSTVDGGRTLTLDADGGSVGQTGAVGGTTRLTSLTIDGGQIDLNTVATTGLIDIGGSNIDLNAGSYTSNDGNIIFRGAVDLHANVMVNSDEDDDSADGNITFTWTIDGAHTLTLDADTGSVELRGAVGGGTKLTSLTVDGGQIDLNSVATTGAIDIEGTNIDLNGTTYESDDGNITFTGPVDLHARDASVTVDSDADNDAANGNITFSSTIDGGYALTLDADVNGGDITVGGTVGGTTRLASFTPIGGAVSLNGVNVSGDFHLNAEEMVMGGHYGSDDGDFTLTGRVILDGAVTVNTDRDGDGDGGDIIFSAAIDGGYALTLNADTGSVTLTGPVGGTTPLASLTVNGGRIDLNTVATTGAIDIVGTNIALNGESYTSEDGDIDFSGAVYLHTDVSMDSDADDDRTDGSIRFTSTLDGGHALTLNADGGNIDFDGDVGSVDKLGAMTVTKAHDVTVATEMNVVSFTQLAGTGTTNFGSNTIHADAFVDVSTRDMYGRIVTQDARLKASNFIGVNVKVGTLTFKARDADINGTVGGNDGQAAADHTMVNNRGPGSYKLNGFTILGTGPGTRTYAELSALPLSRTMESAGHPATPADAVYPTYIPMLRASVMDAIDSPYAVNVYEMQFPLLTPRPGTESWYDELPGVVRGL